MDQETRSTLETLLVAQVLTLSRALHEEQVRKGVHRAGGDYTREAIALIVRNRDPVLAQLAEVLPRRS